MRTIELATLSIALFSSACGGLEPGSEGEVAVSDSAACGSVASRTPDASVAMGSSDVWHNTNGHDDCGYLFEVTNTLGKAERWSSSVRSDIASNSRLNCVTTEIWTHVFGLRNGNWEWIDFDFRNGGWVGETDYEGVCFTIMGGTFDDVYSRIRIVSRGTVSLWGSDWNTPQRFSVRY